MISFEELVNYNPDLTIRIVERYWYYPDKDLTEFDHNQLRSQIKYINPIPHWNNIEWLAKCVIDGLPYTILATRESVEFLDSVPAHWTYRILSAVDAG